MAVIATEDDPSRHIAAGVISQLIEVASSQIDPADQAQWPSLQGPHNAQNAAVAIAVARALGLGDAGIAAALKRYSSLPRPEGRHIGKEVCSTGRIGWATYQ